MATVFLKKGREKSVRKRHPWIFSGAVQRVEGDPAAGEVVRVTDYTGDFLAWGHLSPHSQIQVRLLDWSENAVIDDSWWRARLAASISRRQALLSLGAECPEGDESSVTGEKCSDTRRSGLKTVSYRVVYGEADLLPALVVDRFGDFLVLQAGSAGVDTVKEDLAGHLMEMLSSRGVYERSDMEVRRLEGLPPSEGVLAGEGPPPSLAIRECGYRFEVDTASGQKTGWFLDQRENRAAVAGFAAGAEVLDAFSYTGGFSVHALGAGAKRTTLVDSSAAALAGARRNLELAGAADRAEFLEGDAFTILRRMRDAGRSFDLVILDPPRLAPTRAHARRASRAYKDVNLLGMKLLRPGGILATFSCSGGVDAAFFQEIVSWAAVDAGRDVQVVRRLSQGPDHPVLLSFPESEYLKGLICRVF